MALWFCVHVCMIIWEKLGKLLWQIDVIKLTRSNLCPIWSFHNPLHAAQLCPILGCANENCIYRSSGQDRMKSSLGWIWPWSPHANGALPGVLFLPLVSFLNFVPCLLMCSSREKKSSITPSVLILWQNLPIESIARITFSKGVWSFLLEIIGTLLVPSLRCGLLLAGDE